ncbi:MAG TPA: hypothetical protein IAB01_02620 [Candidatus Avidesulfovibrio excrementigallinarum]|nr:hypothetical protein [Candidatus Avidesulfovibrio excrementigallinarum]
MTADERQQALEAGRILRSGVFRAALDRLDARCVRAWRACADSAQRDMWWHRQCALAAIRRELFDVLQCAALRAQGKDTVLNAALQAAKQTITAQRPSEFVQFGPEDGGSTHGGNDDERR